MTNSTRLNELLTASPSDIEAERARRHLLHFTNFTFPTYQAEPAHELIASTLDRVVNGEIDRLMIFAPPQHGKSELASVRLPAFWFGHNPDSPVILTSYAASLAYSKSRQARQVVESNEYGQLFPVTTDPTSRAVDNWRIDGKRGELIAAGVGGPITGHGALLGIIDDPLENWKQAQSQTVREAIWEWYRTTFRTRIWEHGRIVLIMTRWHEDDLAGRLLQEQGSRWHVLRLPALTETQEERDESNKLLGLPAGESDPIERQPREALCPGRFSKASLVEIKKDTGSVAWAGMYQGVPRAPEGNRFKRAWLEIARESPAQFDALVRYWDKAGTAGGRGPATAGVLMGSVGGLFYVVDVVRGRWSSGEREKTIRQMAELDQARFSNTAIWIEQEPGSGGKESAEATIRNLAGFVIHAETVTGSKEVRAEPFAAQAEAGNVKLVKGDWNAVYIREVTAFPNSTYKDQVDASSGAFNKLAGKRSILIGFV